MSKHFAKYLRSTTALVAVAAIALTPVPRLAVAAPQQSLLLAQSETATEQVEEVVPPEEQPAEQPAEQVQEEAPAAEQPAEQVQQETPAAEQPVEQVQEEAPATEQSAEQQAEEQPVAEEPVQQVTAEEPAAEPPAEQTAEQPPAEEPAQEEATQEPAPEQPAAEQAQEQPAAEQPADQASGEEKPRRERRRDRQQAEQPAEQAPAQQETAEQPASESATEEEQQQAAEEAQQPAEVSAEAEKPKRRQRQSAEEIVEEAETEPTAVVTEEMSREQRQQLRQADQRRRERARENRDELIGAAAVGLVIGATIPLLGGTVAADEGDRIIIRRDGRLYVRKDESALFRDRDNRIDYERMRGGLTRETVTRRNGSQIITVRDPGGRVLRRVKVTPDGRRIVLFDTRDEEINRPYRPIDLPRYRVDIPRDRYVVSARRANRELFYDTFRAEPVYEPPRRYSLQDIRENPEVRGLVRRVDLDTVTFDSGSAFVSESQVALLGDIAGGMLDVIDQDPGAVFLIEGHTDAVGKDIDNLALSDRRAETVARILTEYYEVPPENMVVQGYGEAYLKVQTQGDERANRRVTVRNISPILQTSAE